MNQTRRRTQLIKPWLQIQIGLGCLSIAAIVVVVQGVNLSHALMRVASDLPSEGGLVLSEMSGIITSNVLFTLALLTPLLITVGVLLTFRIAGPLHRIETYLEAVLAGKERRPCTLRDGDSLQELCSLVNRVSAPMREAVPEEALVPDSEPESLVKSSSPAKPVGESAVVKGQ
jgi:hypothetical protein